MREHLVRVRNQVSKEVELLWRQARVTAVNHNLARVKIDRGASELRCPVGLCVHGVRRKAARMRAESSTDLKGFVT